MSRVGFDGQLCAQGRHPGDDPQPFQQLPFGLRVRCHDFGDIGEHLLEEQPGGGRLRCYRIGRFLTTDLESQSHN